MILVNGRRGTEISVLDRGLAYGDGLFETTAVVGHDILNWPLHAARLRHGCERLAFAPPDFELLAEEIRSVAAGCDRAVVKITVTRAVGGSGYTPAQDAAQTRIVARRPWPETYAGRERSGIRVCVARHRLPLNPELAGIKHLNRLDQVLASMELAQQGADEALMLDPLGRVIEATRCNLFAIFGDRLATPALDGCGVRGVMRAVVMGLAAAVELAPEETELTLPALSRADEVFLCNAIAGIWPVVRIAQVPAVDFPVGARTRALQAALTAGGHHP